MVMKRIVLLKNLFRAFRNKKVLSVVLLLSLTKFGRGDMIGIFMVVLCLGLVNSCGG